MTAAAGNGGDLLLLCHRVPYPPDKGDKIRSYRWLRALAERYRVYLGAFVDDPRDWQHAQRVRDLCAEACLLPLSATRAKLRSLPALLTRAPLTRGFYRDRRMSRWVEEVLGRTRTHRIVVYSSAMAQYVSGARFRDYRRVIDFVDVDADKWRQYGEHRRGPMGLVYRREAKRLLAHDVAVAREFDLSLFVSPAEARFFEAVGALGVRPGHVGNGVDHGYFDPGAPRRSPFPPGHDAVVFTGAMDYWANVDAVLWFAETIWPSVRARLPSARFDIVGARPDARVRALAGDHIVVTGRVPDVRPYLQHAAAVVAPMRVARGVQNKVLEGMAMARPVVLSPAALEGIEAEDGETVLLADSQDLYVQRVCEAVSGQYPDMGIRARARIVDAYGWAAASARFLAMVEGGAAGAEN